MSPLPTGLEAALTHAGSLSPQIRDEIIGFLAPDPESREQLVATLTHLAGAQGTPLDAPDLLCEGLGNGPMDAMTFTDRILALGESLGLRLIDEAALRSVWVEGLRLAEDGQSCSFHQPVDAAEKAAILGIALSSPTHLGLEEARHVAAQDLGGLSMRIAAIFEDPQRFRLFAERLVQAAQDKGYRLTSSLTWKEGRSDDPAADAQRLTQATLGQSGEADLLQKESQKVFAEEEMSGLMVDALYAADHVISADGEVLPRET